MYDISGAFSWIPQRARSIPAIVMVGLSLMIAPVAAAQDEIEPAFDLDEYDEYEADDLEPDPLFDDDFDLDIEDVNDGFPDPLETMNRGILAFNSTVDLLIMDPVTQVYRFIFPEQVRRSVTRFFYNANSPQIIVNDALQLEWKDSGVALARLLINSTVGVGGLFDPAASFGMPRHHSDFGQTLAIAGAPSGAFLMLPLLGPTTVRDGIGLGVDAVLHPTFYLLPGTDILFFSGTAGLSERARHFEELKALEESSVDFYAAMRSGYYQNRVSEIWSRREHRRPEGHE